MEERAQIDLGDVTLSCTITDEGREGRERRERPLVIAAHGFPDDATTFREQVPALCAAGYRVAVPTMRGYAPSGLARSGRYDPEALGGDLIALADRLSPGAPVRIIGHDWGAIAGFAAVALAPGRVSHFASLAIPHLRAALPRFLSPAQLRRSWYIGLFQIPGVAEARLAADDLALIERLWRAWSPDYRPSADELTAVKDGIRDRIGPVLAYYRSLPRFLAGPSRRLLLGRTQVPTLRLHGADDGCIGVETGRGEERCYEAETEIRPIAGAGHFLQRERPAEVNEALLSFFRRELP